jgi:ActR/RegA family two-component response regulator
MMAHDSSPGPNVLTEETIEAVRAALVQYVSAPARRDDVGAALQRMAIEARDRSMLPEQLLIVLKDIWYSLPSVRNMSDATDQVRLLQRVVTMCIKEYYST